MDGRGVRVLERQWMTNAVRIVAIVLGFNYGLTKYKLYALSKGLTRNAIRLQTGRQTYRHI